MHTDVVKCDGCGADVVVVATGQIGVYKPAYCPGCTKLNAAKSAAFQSRRCTMCGNLTQGLYLDQNDVCRKCAAMTANLHAAQQAQAKGVYNKVAYKSRFRGTIPGSPSYGGAAQSPQGYPVGSHPTTIASAPSPLLRVAPPPSPSLPPPSSP